MSSQGDTLTCKACGSLFIKSHNRRIFCSKKCCKEYSYSAEWHEGYRKKTPIKQLLHSAKWRAKKRGIVFDLVESDIILPEVCPILGLKLVSNIGKGAGGKDDSYSLDRIVPSLGYVKGNIQVISHKANSMKYNTTKEELLKFAEWVLKTYE